MGAQETFWKIQNVGRQRFNVIGREKFNDSYTSL